MTLAQVATDFGVHEMTISKWLRAADVEDGVKPGVTTDEARELRELKRRNRLLEQENEVLRRRLTCRRPSYREKAALPARESSPPPVPRSGCRRRWRAGCSSSTFLHRQHYYAWLACPVTDSELEEADLANAIFDAHREDPEFGYRLLFDEVTDAGYQVSERTVWKICSSNEWWCVFGKKRRGKKGLPGAPAHDDLVRREFTAPGPNQLWLTDISEHPTAVGKLYICAVKDVWSNRIVGYSIDSRMTSQLAVDALESAVARRTAGGGSVAGCKLHPDRAG